MTYHEQILSCRKCQLNCGCERHAPGMYSNAVATETALHGSFSPWLQKSHPPARSMPAPRNVLVNEASQRVVGRGSW